MSDENPPLALRHVALKVSGFLGVARHADGEAQFTFTGLAQLPFLAGRFDPALSLSAVVAAGPEAWPLPHRD